METRKCKACGSALEEFEPGEWRCSKHDHCHECGSVDPDYTDKLDCPVCEEARDGAPPVPFNERVKLKTKNEKGKDNEIL